MQLPWSVGSYKKANWIESVNVIVARKNITPSTTSQYDYEVCTIESSSVPFVSGELEQINRQFSGKRRYLPGAALHEADFSPEWRKIIDNSVMQQYEKHDQRNRNIQLFSDECIIRKRALECAKLDTANILKPEVALRICALRCLFQELGKKYRVWINTVHYWSWISIHNVSMSLTLYRNSSMQY